MFRSLKLKLTLTNTAVTGLIFLILLSGIYIIMKNRIQIQSEDMLRKIAFDERSPYSPFHTRPRSFDSNYFFVRVDSVGNIVDKSPNLINSEDEIYSLIEKTMKIDKDKGVITIDGVTFRFLKSYSNFRADLLKLVFFNTQSESQLLTGLLFTLILIALITIILTFLASLFMANRSLVPIKKSWERQKAFVADASHELRTPLAVVQTNVELIMGNSDETVESQQIWLENIHSETKRMTDLVNDLLFLARADSNETSIEFSVFPLHSVIKDVIDSFRLICQNKNLDLKSNIDSEVQYNGSKNKIIQLLTILLDNAIKYTDPGGEIKVALVNKENSVELSVSDTGQGIPKEHLGKIFERFYRVDSARASETGGSGLGLSIADFIVKEHRGHINVTSTPGKGSTFVVVLKKD